MSSITFATGGDGWSTWQVHRELDGMTVTVLSKTEQERADSPSGWQQREVFVATITDGVGLLAIEMALSESRRYAEIAATSEEPFKAGDQVRFINKSDYWWHGKSGIVTDVLDGFCMVGIGANNALRVENEYLERLDVAPTPN